MAVKSRHIEKDLSAWTASKKRTENDTGKTSSITTNESVSQNTRSSADIAI